MKTPTRSPERAPDELLDADEDERGPVDEEALLRAAREGVTDRDLRMSQKVGLSDDPPPDNEDGEGEDDDATAERRARTMGWKPESEWRGRPGAWVDARTFLERAYANRGINRQQTNVLTDTIEEQARKIAALEATVAESAKRQEESGKVLGDIWGRFQRADQAGYQRAMNDLREQRREAIADGDVEKVDQLDKKMADLKPPPSNAGQEQQQEKKPAAEEGGKKPVQPEVQAFIDRNPWFIDDTDLNAIVQTIHVRRLQTHKDKESLAENLQWVEDEVRKRYPEKFENEARRGRSTPRMTERRGSDGGDPPPGARKRFEDLPAEAQAACIRYEATIPGFTRKQYLETYDW